MTFEGGGFEREAAQKQEWIKVNCINVADGLLNKECSVRMHARAHCISAGGTNIRPAEEAKRVAEGTWVQGHSKWSAGGEKGGKMQLLLEQIM